MALPDGWYPVPLGSDQASEWSRNLSDRLCDEPAERAALAAELELVRERLASPVNPRLTAAVWVPYPLAGTAAAAVVFCLTDLGEADSAERFEEHLAGYADYREPGLSYYSVQTWREGVDAGPLVGSHNLVSHFDPHLGLAVLEERVVIGVFPPGARQFVQFIFSAENVGAFVNMPQQTQDFVATLTVTLDGPRNADPEATT